MFGVPGIVADNFLKLATGGQIKVLLFLLRYSGKMCSLDEISSNTGVQPDQVEEAIFRLTMSMTYFTVNLLNWLKFCRVTSVIL